MSKESEIKNVSEHKKDEVQHNISVVQPQSTDNDKVGAVLYHERLKKELTLEEISQTLCIRKSYLEAIEKGNYSELPSMPYSAGFVNGYAKFLGLNNTRITQLFREEINAKPNDAKAYISEDVPAEASLPNKFYVLGGVVVIAVLSLLWGVMSVNDEPEMTTNDIVQTEISEDKSADKAGDVEYFVVEQENIVPAEDVKTIDEQEEIVAEEPKAEKEEVKAEDNKISAKGIEIRITKEDTWFEVRDGEKVYANRILKVGEKYLLPEKEGLILSVGKFDGVEVYVDGVLTPIIRPNKKTNINLDNVLNNNR